MTLVPDGVDADDGARRWWPVMKDLMIGKVAVTDEERVTDCGQATILMVFMLFLIFAFALAVAEVGEILDESARARIASDAAALAGAPEGRSSAAYLASLNGAELTAYHEEIVDGGETTLATATVRVGRASVTASASARSEWILPE